MTLQSQSALFDETRRQNAPFREAASSECAFPSRRGAREVWGNPPARLRGTMENASTGQMRSSNPPPACGAGCAGVRRSRFGVWPHGKAHSAQPVGSRMRFSVRRRRVCAGEEKRTLRKGAFWLHALTERRTLQPPSRGKARPAPATPSRRDQKAYSGRAAL